jgi:hypothetical protein
MRDTIANTTGKDDAAKNHRGIFFGEQGDGLSVRDEIRGNTITGDSAEDADRGILVSGDGEEIDIRDNQIVQAAQKGE